MRVLIIDDDFFITTALKTILEADSEIQVCGSGKNGKEAVSLYDSLHPDILLMDIRMEEMDGLAASAEILARDPRANILLLTTFLDDEYIIRALKLGARGYLLKQNYNSIIPALKAVFSGQTVYGNEITAKLPNLLTGQKTFPWETYHIGPRELEVIALVAQGMSNKEIARSLYLSEGTVRNYLSAILDKLNLRDRTQLAVFYLKHEA
ncbi:MAG TPA: response regulator transcription factor [Candidatus Fusicatenibacter intestinigallinarum]|uniref:Stage 0 sporulation protein A homolog n=1 Tax=Candidatus Fusicatenibacter intestinigallinarum TaxID=2838598 RepID=A0A9D2NBX6_9FIRM|nr:response regulator transcription factor [Candidatus Fusicatenibacter intestinigallinarum]